MNKYNFIIGPTDTDSISFCKSDMSPFSEQELNSIIEEINSISPEFMVWDHDGYYSTCVALKAKNYALKYDEEYFLKYKKVNDEKIIIKGSAFKDQKKEQSLQEFMVELTNVLLNEGLDYPKLQQIYQKYINEIDNITDIKRWSQKKTITNKILQCKGHKEMSDEYKDENGIRKNETDVYDALAGRKTQEGDKIWVYPVQLPPKTITGRLGKNGNPLKDKILSQNGLKLDIDWKNDEDRVKLRERVDATLNILSNILDVEKVKDEKQ